MGTKHSSRSRAGFVAAERADTDFDSESHFEMRSKPFPMLGIKPIELDIFITRVGGEGKLARLSTTEVCDKFLKPLTATSAVSYCDLLAAEFCGNIGLATHYISHAWECEFLSVVETLRDYFTDKPHAVIFFDVFSYNQHSTDKLDTTWWTTTIRAAIEQIAHTVVVYPAWNHPVPLTRSWCLYEIYCTAISKGKVDVAMRTADLSAFANMLTRQTNEYDKLLSNIDVARSNSRKLADRDMIFAVIRGTIGFNHFNNIVTSSMRAWAVSTLVQSLANDPRNSFHRHLALGELYRLNREFDKASDEFDMAMQEAVATDGGVGELSAEANHSLGLVNTNLGKLEDAMIHYEEAISLKLATLGDSHISTGVTFNSIAVLFHKLGRMEEALQYLEKSLLIKVGVYGELHVEVGNTYNSKAVILQTMGEFDRALDCFQKSLRIFRSCPGNNMLISTGNAHNSIAGLYIQQERLDEALEMYNSALRVRMEALDKHHPCIADTYCSIALVLEQKAAFKLSLDYYEKALQVKISYYGENHPSVGNIYTLIAMIQRKLHRLDEALDSCSKALVISILSLGEKHLSVGIAYNNMSNIYSQKGEIDKALHYYEMALGILRVSLGDNHPSVGDTCFNMGIMKRRKRRFKDALDFYQRALSCYLVRYGPENHRVVDVYKHMKEVHEAMDDTEKAEIGSFSTIAETPCYHI